jgi:hypothetical protein
LVGVVEAEAIEEAGATVDECVNPMKNGEGDVAALYATGNAKTTNWRLRLAAIVVS